MRQAIQIHIGNKTNQMLRIWKCFSLVLFVLHTTDAGPFLAQNDDQLNHQTCRAVGDRISTAIIAINHSQHGMLSATSWVFRTLPQPSKKRERSEQGLLAAKNALLLGLFLYSFEHCKETADWLLLRTKQRPRIAIICGSGLGPLADALEKQESFKYIDIPNFPQSTGMACSQLCTSPHCSRQLWDMEFAFLTAADGALLHMSREGLCSRG